MAFNEWHKARVCCVHIAWVVSLSLFSELIESYSDTGLDVGLGRMGLTAGLYWRSGEEKMGFSATIDGSRIGSRPCSKV
jgi:hypothetical protein